MKLPGAKRLNAMPLRPKDGPPRLRERRQKLKPKSNNVCAMRRGGRLRLRRRPQTLRDVPLKLRVKPSKIMHGKSNFSKKLNLQRPNS